MLHVPLGAGFGLITPSWGTTRPAAANGTAVTPATTNAWGTAVQLHTATTVDTYGILVNINSNAGSAASRNSAIQIGIDEAGGTTYIYRIGPILCGGAGAYNIGASGTTLYFPIFIPAGSTIAVQARGSVATAFRVGTILMQEYREPAVFRRASFTETIGVTLGAATANGVTVTPGTTAEGAWTTLGTTAKRLWHWQIGVQITTADTAWGANVLHMDLAVGNATTKDIIMTDVLFTTDAAENLFLPLHGTMYDVPAGSTIYGRIQNSGTNDAYTMCAYGAGG
jgi:hypothetical protein